MRAALCGALHIDVCDFTCVCVLQNKKVSVLLKPEFLHQLRNRAGGVRGRGEERGGAKGELKTKCF